MCLTESLVQCYMDRELANDLLAQAMAHLDECSKCKSNLDQAMIEEKLVRRALAYEMALPIPTVQLNWFQPHEGSIVDFLFRARAFQSEGAVHA